MLADHRRTFVHAAALLFAMLVVFVAVGRNDVAAAPGTTFAPIGRLDLEVFELMGEIRAGWLTEVARALNVLGAGVVTIPLRMVVGGWLGWRRRWRALAVWLATWGLAEVVLASAKAFFHRGRPPSPLVDVVGHSFPSGHAVAAAATAVSLVLVLMPSGRRRRKWEAVAVAWASVMAFSRVYLHAHWLSDVVAGVLLGTGIALAVASVVTEVRDHLIRRTRHAPAEGSPAPP